MNQEIAIEAGRTLLEAAHEAAQSGNQTYVHVDGLDKLEVRQVQFGLANSPVATIRIWTSDRSMSAMWIVRLTQVRAIEVQEHATFALHHES